MKDSQPIGVKDYLKEHFMLREGPRGEIEIENTTRWHLAGMLRALDYKVGVEVGVAAGLYSNVLAKANPQMKLYSIDPWLPYPGYKDYQKDSTFAQLEREARERLERYPNSEIIKEFSMDAVKRFEDNSLDFVYIDANHRDEFVTQDVTKWYKKVKPGGVIAGDDYARIGGRGLDGSDNWAVIKAVQRYINEHKLDLYIWGYNGKLPGLSRDPIRSWMVIK